MFWLDLAHFLVVAFNRILRCPKVLYLKEPYRIRGGAMLCANHTCFNDPVLLHTTVWYRRVFFMAAEAAFRNPLAAFCLKGAGCLKVDRNISDIEALRNVTEHLKAGFVVGVFPQGQVHRDQSLESIKSGAILMAAQAGAPIIPMYLSEKKKFLTRRTVIFGEPLACKDYCKGSFPTMKEVNALTEELFARMVACRDYYEKKVRK